MKKILSLLLVLCMVAVMLPVAAFAADGTYIQVRFDRNGTRQWNTKTYAGDAVKYGVTAEDGTLTDGTADNTDNDDGKDTPNVVSDKHENIRHGDLNEDYQEWLAEAARVSGDIKVIPVESKKTDADGNETTVIDAYEILFFMERDDNEQPMANVRHLLVAFEGGTTSATGTVTYSEAEKEAAKAEAERLLQLWKEGAANEESFIALLKEHSDDRDQNGEVNNEGLYEDINPNSNYVESFLNWATDPDRKIAETGIIATEYGYHIMFFSSFSETTYREYMITEDLRAEKLEAWYNAIVEPVTMTIVNTKRIKLDLAMAALG